VLNAVKPQGIVCSMNVLSTINKTKKHAYRMKRLLFLLCFVPGAVALHLPAQAFEAGAAKIEITPPVGTPLNGYGDRMGKNSTGVHDPLWARALYLNDGNTQLFWVSLDLVAVNPELRQRVEELVADLINPENIILTATHTHNGHGGMCRNIPFRFVSGRFIPDVLETTAVRIAEAMKNAFSKRRTAALGYAVGNHDGITVNRRYSGGPVDPQLGVIMIEDSDGNPIAFLSNLAAHPTSIGDGDKFNFSADYPGFYYDEMDSLLGADCVSFFLNGAEGNQTISPPGNKGGWERTEAMGRALANQAFELSQSLSFSEPTLSYTQKMASLPPSLASFFHPDEVLIASLEINDLLISFFPGEPCVELGLKMRSIALNHGYGAHLSVGLSNDYLGYFVPRHLYADLTYESAMTFFGPGTEDWFYEQFESVMTRGAAAPDPVEAFKEAPVETLDGGSLVTLSGSPQHRGLQRGNLFTADIQMRYEQRVVQSVAQGTWLPEGGFWKSIPSFVNVPVLALAFMGMGSRNLLKDISLELLQEMEGMATGARLPFDGLWLLQNAPLYDSIDDKALLYAAPICTMAAVIGKRAGKEELIIGRNLDWRLQEKGVVTKVLPDEGHAFLQAGFTWNAGLLTAMNEKGLVLCVERLHPEVGQLPEKAPLEFLLRDIIQYAVSYADAIERLQRIDHIRNTHVLVAGMEGQNPRAAIVEMGETVTVREAEDGVLLGVLPENVQASSATRKRYATARELLNAQPELSVETLKQILTGAGQPAVDNLERIWNAQTRHSVVFLPSAQVMEVAFPVPSGTVGKFTRLSLSEKNYD